MIFVISEERLNYEYSKWVWMVGEALKIYNDSYVIHNSYAYNFVMLIFNDCDRHLLNNIMISYTNRVSKKYMILEDF